MRFIFAALSLFCLLITFLTNSPGLMGLAILGLVVFAFLSVLGFAQAKFEAGRQQDAFIPSPQEIELMRRAAEKRKAAANADKPDDTDE